MTNNPTIDGVSLLPCPFCGSKELSARYHSPQANWIQCDECDSESPAFDSKAVLLSHWNTRVDSPAVERQEVGELGAMRRLAEDSCNELVGRCVEHADQVAALQSTIAKLQARIVELESGRGEADAWALLNGGGLIRDLTSRWDVAKHWDGIVEPMYFAPPAPVAVVLPERKTTNPFTLNSMEWHCCNDENSEWNACLDATAALNGERK